VDFICDIDDPLSPLSIDENDTSASPKLPEGKPVKNSLLHLVMDEDISQLLEAMAEEVRMQLVPQINSIRSEQL